MKKLTTLIFSFAAFNVFAQSGLTTYPHPPGGYNLVQLRNKNCIAADLNSNVYIGWQNIGLGKFNVPSQTWTMFDTTNSGIASNNIKSLAIAFNGDVYVGTDKGLSKFNSSVWANYTISNSALANDTINALYPVANGMWIGTSQGLSFFNGTNFTNYTTSNSGLTDNFITCFDVDSSNVLWIGTKNGLNRFDGTLWINYTTQNSSILSNYILSFKNISSKTSWVLTSGGLCKIVNGIAQNISPNLGCMYQNFINAFFGLSQKVLVKKSGSNKIYFLERKIGYSRLLRISEDDKMEICIDSIMIGPIGSSFNVAVFDVVGILWTGYYATNSALSAYNETNGSGFLHSSFISTAPTSEFLDINNVGALLHNRGDMFWDLSGSSMYSVPKCSGKTSIFAAALWLGGFDQTGTLHTAAQTYRQTGNDFWPGPIDTTTGIFDPVISNSFDHIWKLNRLTIEDFQNNFIAGNVSNGTYIVPDEILTYPAIGTGNITRNLSPYIDFNSDGNYNPYDGDYPLIRGDQELYYIFNDADTPHTETGGLPFGFEIHSYAYAYACGQNPLGTTNAVLDYTTFYHYDIINRSNNTYDSVFIGIWTDSDLGSYDDDYVGCDTVLNIGYSYNGDPVDDLPAGYGNNPPMINLQILKGPDPVPNDGIDNDHDGLIDEPGEINMMATFKYYDSDFAATGNPETSDDFYEYITARWKDGTHQTYGGNGYGGSINTNYMFSGPPYDSTAWNDGGNIPFDRRFIVSSGPFSIAPGETRSIDYAYIFTWDSTAANGPTTSWARNVTDVQTVKQWFDANNFPSCLYLNTQHANPKNSLLVYPNPVTDILTIAGEFKNQDYSYEIFDITGRCLKKKKLAENGRVVTAALKPSVYVLRVYNEKNVFTTRFIKR